jgi:hypothetical protein
MTISATSRTVTHEKPYPVSPAAETKRYQRRGLRQAPLTFVRNATSPSGTASTLGLRVNDVLWTEVPSFYGRRSDERVYLTRLDDDGKTATQFGDGVHGARLPTGQENIRATYRKGTGVGGNVRAGQLTTLLTRPLGLKSAINPQPASGGDDGEPRELASENAPITVLTLDRVVSLRDTKTSRRGRRESRGNRSPRGVGTANDEACSSRRDRTLPPSPMTSSLLTSAILRRGRSVRTASRRQLPAGDIHAMFAKFEPEFDGNCNNT